MNITSMPSKAGRFGKPCIISKNDKILSYIIYFNHNKEV